MTGYVIHYSDGDTDRTESVPASSTSSLITGLTINLTYNISVEATSQHLSGESEVVEFNVTFIPQPTVAFTTQPTVAFTTQPTEMTTTSGSVIIYTHTHITYTISVEATSEHLSGESGSCIISKISYMNFV